MGALGHRVHGKHKNKASKGHLGSRRSVFDRYGRGNFPGHDVLRCLSKNGLNECRCIQSGLNGRGWMWVQGGRQKTRQKELKMGENDMFYEACTQCKKVGRCQTRTWWPERTKGNNRGQKRGAQSKRNVLRQ